jgi:hypothetical protein
MAKLACVVVPLRTAVRSEPRTGGAESMHFASRTATSDAADSATERPKTPIWKLEGQASEFCHPSFFAVLRGSGCTPRIGWWRFTTRETASRASAVAGRTKLPWRRRERQPDGSTAGGHPHFFGDPMLLRSTLQPAIRLYLLRDPVSRPFARPQRERAGLPARRNFARSRIRCSWRLGPVRFRQASSQADDDGMRHEGPPEKICHGPSLRPHPPRNPTFHARCPTRNGEALHRLWGMPPNDD